MPSSLRAVTTTISFGKDYEEKNEITWIIEQDYHQHHVMMMIHDLFNLSVVKYLICIFSIHWLFCQVILSWQEWSSHWDSMVPSSQVTIFKGMVILFDLFIIWTNIFITWTNILSIGIVSCGDLSLSPDSDLQIVLFFKTGQPCDWSGLFILRSSKSL